MKTLIVEDDVTSRVTLLGFLRRYGPAHMADNGREAVEAVRTALALGQHYELICLDILMPEMDGLQALAEIRHLEEAAGIAGPDRAKIIMTTSVADEASIMKAREWHCDYFIVKPVQKEKLLDQLRRMGLIV